MTPTQDRPAAPANRPFATATIARIYAEQGKLAESLEIYRALLRNHPADEALRRAVAQVERRLTEAREPPSGSGDHLTLKVEDARLLCSWSVSTRGRRGATLVLGQSGTLALRMMGFPRDEGAPPRDHRLDQSTGSELITPPAGASMVAAAVGLVGSEGRFVSIAHCDLLAL